MNIRLSLSVSTQHAVHLAGLGVNVNAAVRCFLLSARHYFLKTYETV